MTTVDASGAIHAADGKFAGHIAGEPDDAVSLASPESFEAQIVSADSVHLAMAQAQAALSFLGEQQRLVDELSVHATVRRLNARIAEHEARRGPLVDPRIEYGYGDEGVTVLDNVGGFGFVDSKISAAAAADLTARVGTGPQDGDHTIAISQLDVDAVKTAAADDTGMRGVLDRMRELTDRETARFAHADLRDAVRTKYPTARTVSFVNYDGSTDLTSVRDSDGNVLYDDLEALHENPDEYDHAFAESVSGSIGSMGAHCGSYRGDYVPAGHAIDIIDLEATGPTG